MLDLAIVGGGPGGLMSAWYLKKKLGALCRITIYEASDRLGGKILTKTFDTAPAMYEAGFVSAAHTAADIDETVAAARDVFRLL